MAIVSPSSAHGGTCHRKKYATAYGTAPGRCCTCVCRVCRVSGESCVLGGRPALMMEVRKWAYPTAATGVVGPWRRSCGRSGAR
jgi:hypothetical protein